MFVIYENPRNNNLTQFLHLSPEFGDTVIKKLQSHGIPEVHSRDFAELIELAIEKFGKCYQVVVG